MNWYTVTITGRVTGPFVHKPAAASYAKAQKNAVVVSANSKAEAKRLARFDTRTEES